MESVINEGLLRAMQRMHANAGREQMDSDAINRGLAYANMSRLEIEVAGMTLNDAAMEMHGATLQERRFDYIEIEEMFRYVIDPMILAKAYPMGTVSEERHTPAREQRQRRIRELRERIADDGRARSVGAYRYLKNAVRPAWQRLRDVNLRGPRN